MKYAEITLLSLLLFGFCSPRTLETPKPRQMNDVNYSQPTLNNLRAGRQDKAEDQKSQQLAQHKNIIHQKLKNTNQRLTSPGNYYVQFDNLPDFADPVYVGSAVDHYSLVQVSYDNVQFQGLNSTHQAVLNVNVQSQVATLTLNLEKAEVHGNYAGFDLAQNISGKFYIKMQGNITYVCTYHYEVQDGHNVRVLRSSGQLHYQSSVSHYNIIVSYSPLIQKALQTVLLQTVDERVHQVLLAKLNDRIQKYILEIYPNHQHDSIEKGIREGINDTINGILQMLTKHGVFSIDLTSNDKEIKEIVYNKLQAKIISVRLNGMEKFYLASNQVFHENSDKIRAKVQLAISRSTSTTIVSINEVHNENSPFQNIVVDFDIEQLIVELSLDYSTHQSGLELHSVQTNVNRIRPLGTEKFESQISNLIKEQLTYHIKLYIEESLKNFIQNEFIAIIIQGVLPPTQVKRSAQNQM